MARYYPITSVNVKIPREQYYDVQNQFKQKYQGSTYKGANDFDKFLYERYLNNSRSIDQDCSETLEQIKKKNIPDGTAKSQESLMYWSSRSGGEQSRDPSTGLFR